MTSHTRRINSPPEVPVSFLQQYKKPILIALAVIFGLGTTGAGVYLSYHFGVNSLVFLGGAGIGGALFTGLVVTLTACFLKGKSSQLFSPPPRELPLPHSPSQVKPKIQSTDVEREEHVNGPSTSGTTEISSPSSSTTTNQKVPDVRGIIYISNTTSRKSGTACIYGNRRYKFQFEDEENRPIDINPTDFYLPIRGSFVIKDPDGYSLIAPEEFYSNSISAPLLELKQQLLFTLFEEAREGQKIRLYFNCEYIEFTCCNHSLSPILQFDPSTSPDKFLFLFKTLRTVKAKIDYPITFKNRTFKCKYRATNKLPLHPFNRYNHYLPSTLFKDVKEGETIRFYSGEQLIELTCSQSSCPHPSYSPFEDMRDYIHVGLKKNHFPHLYSKDLKGFLTYTIPILGVPSSNTHIFKSIVSCKDIEGNEKGYRDFTFAMEDEKQNGAYAPIKVNGVYKHDNTGKMLCQFDIFKHFVFPSEILILETEGLGGTFQTWLIIPHKPELHSLTPTTLERERKLDLPEGFCLGPPVACTYPDGSQELFIEKGQRIIHSESTLKHPIYRLPPTVFKPKKGHRLSDYYHGRSLPINPPPGTKATNFRFYNNFLICDFEEIEEG